MLQMLSLGMQAFGAGSSVASSYYGAKAKRSQLEFQASIAEQNARLAELSAQTEMERGRREYGAIRLKGGQLKSRQRAAMAANGIDLGYGTAAELQASTEAMSQIDADTILSNAVRSAWGYRTQGTNFGNEAAMQRAGAAGISPALSAGTTLLGAAGDVARSWYWMQKVGAFDQPASDRHPPSTWAPGE